MRHFILIALAASTALAATPAAARDGSVYIGVEGGLLFARDLKIDGNVSQTGSRTFGASDVGGLYRFDLNKGVDLDVNLGYDFGLIRAEVEGGYKRAGVGSIDGLPITGGITTPLVIGAPATSLDASGKVAVSSIMGNVLFDLGGRSSGIAFYAGGGAGYAKIGLEDINDGSGRTYGGSDGGLAWQLIAGARAPLNDLVDFGIKYRYFRSSSLDFDDINSTASRTFACTTAAGGAGTCNRFIDGSGRFRSHSIMASLIFNLSPVPAPPPLPAPPPPPPPPPPATQTCPDGSVILATDSCPLPPPPPPPPPPAPERG